MLSPPIQSSYFSSASNSTTEFQSPLLNRVKSGLQMSAKNAFEVQVPKEIKPRDLNVFDSPSLQLQLRRIQLLYNLCTASIPNNDLDLLRSEQIPLPNRRHSSTALGRQRSLRSTVLLGNLQNPKQSLFSDIFRSSSSTMRVAEQSQSQICRPLSCRVPSCVPSCWNW